MTTIVGRLARSLSQGPDALGHRHSSSATDEDNLSPRRMGLQRLSGSPSFNDFSLSVQEDAEEEYRPLVVGQISMKPEDIIGVHRPEAMRYQPAVPSSPPPSSTLLPGAMLASPRAVKSKHIKIMDMDPYDYCELLRGSSL